MTLTFFLFCLEDEQQPTPLPLLSQKMQHRSNEVMEEFIKKLGSYRKRVTAYRSRRYKLRKNDFVVDAIAYARAAIVSSEK